MVAGAPGGSGGSGDGAGSRVGLRGIGPALAGNVGTGGAFALSREGGSGCRRSNARSGPIPLPPETIRLSLGVWRDLGGGPAGGLGYGKPRAARNRSWLAETRLDSPIDQPNVIRMETVTISPKFQIVIPQRIRESMGLRSGEKAHVLAFRNRIEVIPIRDMRALRGYFKGIDTSVVREGDQV